MNAPRLLAVAIGIVGALCALALTVPIPWLTGSLAACALCSVAGLKLSPPPDGIERLMRMVIGVSLGPSIAGSLASSSAGLTGVLATALALVALSVLLGARWFAYRLSLAPASAYLCAMPGGLSMLLGMADGIPDRTPVLLAHTVRVVTVVLVVSVLARVLGVPPVAAPLLAFAPGGIAEVSLVALALGLDAGLVALVHGVRFLFIVLAGPVGLWWLSRRRTLHARTPTHRCRASCRAPIAPARCWSPC